ncbi:hypothetical protein BC834DRAFT_175808 [Gloeopeniophorella convolvens]|nr:hypothetical protein BC834DRAFT_175808 [Gloeopeniophorella convolvens]
MSMGESHRAQKRAVFIRWAGRRDAQGRSRSTRHRIGCNGSAVEKTPGLIAAYPAHRFLRVLVLVLSETHRASRAPPTTRQAITTQQTQMVSLASALAPLQQLTDSPVPIDIRTRLACLPLALHRASLDGAMTRSGAIDSFRAPRQEVTNNGIARPLQKNC